MSSLPPHIKPENYGFNAFANEQARGGIVYVNNQGLKWVKNLEALKIATGANEVSLAHMGYAIDTYHEIENTLSLFSDSAA
jgi:hypothetical protein